MWLRPWRGAILVPTGSLLYGETAATEVGGPAAMCQVISNAVAASDAYADADTDASKQTAAVPATGVNTIMSCS